MKNIYRHIIHLILNEMSWHLATNFLRASLGASAEGACWRYDRISMQLTKTEGKITAHGALDLLAEVSQVGTQWSVVYGISTGDVKVIMGRQYDDVYTFPLSFTGE